MPLRVAVLASNSFAGSAYVANALSRGAEVLGISRSPEADDIFLSYKAVATPLNFRFVQLDLNRDFEKICETLADFRPEAVVDLAGQGMVAESWSAPEQWYQTNIVSKVRLHDFLKDQSWLKRYVRVSTPEVYGSCDKPVAEGQPYNPSSPYAVSHAAIDMSLAAFHRNYAFPVIFGRFANFFGEHQQLYRIVPKTILSIRSGSRLPLHGGGKSMRAFIHASDAAEGITRMIESGATGETYHFTPRRFHTIREVVETICSKLGADVERVTESTADRPGKDMAYLMDPSKAERELDWAPRVGFGDGIDRTVAWVDRNFSRMRSLPWNYVHKQ